MLKIVVNRCYGGYGLSNAAIKRYADLKGIEMILVPRTKYGKEDWQWHSEHWEVVNATDDDERHFSYHDIDRTDPELIQTVEELGNAANGEYAELRVVEIPDDVSWYIDDYDGIETVRENHRSW